MTISLRTEFNGGASLETVRALIGLPRPASVAAVLARWNESVTFEEPLVTADGVALGGDHKVTVSRNGDWHYEGHFRATGFPSFNVSVAAHVTGTDGTVLLFSAQGQVFGTNESGDREYNFDQRGNNPLIRYQWAGFRHAQFTHDLQFDANYFGSAGELLALVTEAALVVAVGGVGALVVVCAAEASIANLQELSLPGTVGVVVTGGVLLVFGPAAIMPALVFGVAAGAATAALVKQRALRDDEWSVVETVFPPGQLPRERILITNLTGIGGRPFTMPAPGDVILVNLGGGFDDPTKYAGKGGDNDGSRKPGQLLIHELTHAWQIAHSHFTPGLMCTGIFNQVGTLGGNMDVYKYGPATQNWDQFNLEQQGKIVDDWFAGTGRQATFPPMTKEESNPYWRYIKNYVWAGVP
jgi:hypothetical protein